MSISEEKQKLREDLFALRMQEVLNRRETITNPEKKKQIKEQIKVVKRRYASTVFEKKRKGR